MGMEGTECDVRNYKGPEKDLRGFASSRCSVWHEVLGISPFSFGLFLFLSSVLYVKESLCIP